MYAAIPAEELTSSYCTFMTYCNKENDVLEVKIFIELHVQLFYVYSFAALYLSNMLCAIKKHDKTSLL